MNTHFFGLNTPCFLKTSTTMGTVELTGLEMMAMWASGATRPIADARSRTMEALVCKVRQYTFLENTSGTYVEEVVTGHLCRGVSTGTGGRESEPECDLHQAGQGRGRSVQGEWYEMWGRTYLAGNASGDDDDVGALESLIELVGGVALDLDRAGRLAARYT